MRGLRLFVGAAIAGGLLWILFSSLQPVETSEVYAAGSLLEGDVQRAAVKQSVIWLVEEHQNEDGGYASFSQGAGMGESDVGGTVDALLALASSGYNPARPYPGREGTPIAFLHENVEAVTAYAAQNGAAAGKLILALTASAQDPRDFGGYDLTISLTQHLSPTGQYNVVTPFEQSLAVLAQAVVSDGVPAEAMAWLRAGQAQEGEMLGSWDDGFGTEGNVDATAMAIMALMAGDATGSEEAVADARTFLMESQLESGGWGYAPGLPESANSTALAIQALSALGEDYYSQQSEWARSGVSPLDALQSWQGESGAFMADFGEGPAEDFFTTVQALPAITGRAYPLPARFEAVRVALSCMEGMRDGEVGGWPEFAAMGPSAGGTARAIRAIAAADDPGSMRWVAGGQSPLDALRTLTPSYLEGGRGGRLGAVMRAAAVAGADVRSFDGLDLELMMSDYLSPTGEYDDTRFGPYSHVQAMLGLVSAGLDVDPLAWQWLLDAQGDDGGWGDPDGSGIAVHVLATADEEAYGEATDAGVSSLRLMQLADGGWGFEAPSSVNSSSEVAQGLVAAGQNPFAPDWSVVVSGTLRNAADVALVQQGDNGCWPNLFGEGDDPYATTDGIILLALEPPFGDVSLQPEEFAPEETATAEPEATEEVVQEATQENEVVIEATEIIPSPTAEPAAVDEEILPLETGDEVNESAPGQAGDDGQDSGALILWIIGALLLLIAVMIYFRWSSGS